MITGITKFEIYLLSLLLIILASIKLAAILNGSNIREPNQKRETNRLPRFNNINEKFMRINLCG